MASVTAQGGRAYMSILSMGNAGAAQALVIEDAEEGNYLAAALGALPFGIQGVKAFKSVKIIKKSKGRIVSEEVITGAQAAERAGAAPKGMEAVRRLGTEGEAAAGITKNTQRIESLSGTARYRIPDELSPTTLREVKNVARLDFDAQIRDSLHYAIMTNREMVLVVRRTTQLSQPLQDAVRAGWIRLEFLP